MNDGRFKKGQIAWNKGIKNSTGFQKSRFKKGNFPKNTNPVGYEMVNSYGWHMIKVEGYRTMQYKHHHLWRQHNGEIPKGSIIRFLDDDKNNITIENLICVTRAENCLLNKINFNDEPPELKPVILLMARLTVKTRKLSS
jgi:hypothetical protein